MAPAVDGVCGELKGETKEWAAANMGTVQSAAVLPREKTDTLF